MNKKYTKKQITNAIAYWQKQLNESYTVGSYKPMPWSKLIEELKKMDQSQPFSIIATDPVYEETYVDGDYAVAINVTTEGVLQIGCSGTKGNPLTPKDVIAEIDSSLIDGFLSDDGALVQVGYGQNPQASSLEDFNGGKAFIADILDIDANAEDYILNLKLVPNKSLNETEQLNEGWLGGLLGAVAAGIVGALGFPSLILLGCAIYGGHKIQQYFEKRSAAKNLNDQELAMLAALQEASSNGIATKEIDTVSKKANADVKETIDTLDKLVSLDLADLKNGRYFISAKGKGILKDAGYKPQAVDKDAKNLEKSAKMDEARHDGHWLPKYPTHRNPTEKPTIYYLGVDESDDFRGYGSYIMPNGNLTSGASNDDFRSAAVTKVPASLKAMIDRAVARYGKDKYIFVFKEAYTYGTQTHKSHARPSVIDVWYPNGQYWRYGLSTVEALQENDMLKGKPHNNHLDESQYSSLTKIEVYDIEFLDAGTTTDIASSKYKSVQIDINIGKSLAMQIEKWFDLNVGIIPIAYKFKTIDSVKCKDYDDLKNENN